MVWKLEALPVPRFIFMRKTVMVRGRGGHGWAAEQHLERWLTSALLLQHPTSRLHLNGWTVPVVWFLILNWTNMAALFLYCSPKDIFKKIRGSAAESLYIFGSFHSGEVTVDACDLHKNGRGWRRVKGKHGNDRSFGPFEWNSAPIHTEQYWKTFKCLHLGQIKLLHTSC